jgi:circadian clock protein KaiC
MEKRVINLEKLPTGIPGFDSIAKGGLPLGRSTLVSGTAGSAKTVFAIQFLVEGIRQEEQPGVFITFEESVADIERNMASFGWDLNSYQKNNMWRFIDASPQPNQETVIIGGYDLGGLLARIENAVRTIGAKRVALDSLGAVLSQFNDATIMRRELFRITAALKKMGVTSVITAEREDEYGSIARYGLEEFVTDNVIILRNVLEVEKRRRTVEILKFRGTDHQKGEYPFTIQTNEGIVIIPLSALELKQSSSNKRVTSGNDELNVMCGGGFFRDSIILVSGATGTGKTLMSTEFIDGGARNGERCLLLAFEESRQQLFRNATGWGRDFQKLEDEGKLEVICTYPEVTGLEDHLLNIKEAVDRVNPHRVAIDSLSALERVSTVRGFREFVIALTSFIKQREIVGLFTATTSQLMGGESITEAHISTITDSIILLRYVELFGEMRRGITVLKMRGSMHDKNIREFNISSDGLHIGKPFRSVAGIISGHPTQLSSMEVDRLNDLFIDDL